VPGIKYDQLKIKTESESSELIRSRVEAARNKQRLRFEEIKISCNAQLRSRDFENHCPLSSDARSILHQSFQNLKLSMRAHDRIIKVARTIADMDQSDVIEAKHIAEAVQYRSLDRQG
jgi:magnesium chelatase family protein